MLQKQSPDKMQLLPMGKPFDRINRSFDTGRKRKTRLCVA